MVFCNNIVLWNMNTQAERHASYIWIEFILDILHTIILNMKLTKYLLF